MKRGSGATTSVLMTTAEMPSRPPIDSNTTADVCIVGVGIAGLTAAYLLAQEGPSVVVLDDGPIGGGETSRTTAHLVNALDDRYSDIEIMHGSKGAQLAAASHTAAVDRIEAIIARENIECDFERLDGYLFVPPGEATDILEKELALPSLAHEATERNLLCRCLDCMREVVMANPTEQTQRAGSSSNSRAWTGRTERDRARPFPRDDRRRKIKCGSPAGRLVNLGAGRGKVSLPPPAQEDELTKEALATPETVRILLIEDNAANADLVRYSLDAGHFRHKLTTLTDGEEALAFIRREAPTLTRCRGRH